MNNVAADPDAPVQCEVLKDFEVRGIWYRTGGKPITLRQQTAKILQLVGKIRILSLVTPDVVLHTR